MPVLEKRVSKLEETVSQISELVLNLGVKIDLLIQNQEKSHIEWRERFEKERIETNKRLDRLEKEMKEFKDEMKDFKDEMKEFKDEMKDFKDEMKEFKDEMKDFKNEMCDFKSYAQDMIDRLDRDIKEIQEDRKRRNREWADLAKKLGTVVEDIVVPNIPYIGQKYFGLNNYFDFMVRRKKKNPFDKSQEKEFDIIVVYETKIIFNETKATAKMEYVEEFVNFIKNNEFYQYFPEYKDIPLIPVFASLYIPDNILQYLSKNRIFAMAMKDDTMDLLNPKF